MVVSILDELGFHHEDKKIQQYVRKELLKMDEALGQDVFISFVIKETSSWAHLIKYKLADAEFSKRAKTVGGGMISEIQTFVCGSSGYSHSAIIETENFETASINIQSYRLAALSVASFLGGRGGRRCCFGGAVCFDFRRRGCVEDDDTSC
mmetsp:Transcript_1968/g.4296  ORF Transcript_1968/g.4296 Transcript_1968/m.4296 type:complete len:151 (+) Transcript_1968:146-598(+)